MKAQPLTDAAGPGGRPRRTRPKPSAFAGWVAHAAQCGGCGRVLEADDGNLPAHQGPDGRRCLGSGMPASPLTPKQIADLLKVAVSSVYNLRNAYFAPGLDLALRIAVVSGGAVPADSWPAPRRRSPKEGKRRAR